MDKMRVMTPDEGHTKVGATLTPKQWTVYYYLIAICKWNATDKEKHYYVYDSALNISKASKFLNISRTTFYKALSGLEKEGILERHDKYYIIDFPAIYSMIEQNTILFLLNYQQTLGIDLIRVYTILNRIVQCNLNNKITKRKLVKILGRSDKDGNAFRQVELYLGFLDYWGLVDMKGETVYSKEFGNYKEFTISKVNTILNSDMDLKGEMNAPCDEDEINKIKVQLAKEGFWDIDIDYDN